MKKLIICTLAAAAAINIGLASSATPNYNGSFRITNASYNSLKVSFALQSDAPGAQQLTCDNKNITDHSAITIKSTAYIICHENKIPNSNAYYASTITVKTTNKQYYGTIGIPGVVDPTSLDDAVNRTTLSSKNLYKGADDAGHIGVLLLPQSN